MRSGVLFLMFVLNFQTPNHAAGNPPFLRIRRSAIVNLDFVVELRPVAGGDCRVLLREGTVLTLSRSFRKRARISGIMVGQADTNL